MDSIDSIIIGDERRFTDKQRMAAYIKAVEGLGFLACRDWFLMSVLVVKGNTKMGDTTIIIEVKNIWKDI